MKEAHAEAGVDPDLRQLAAWMTAGFDNSEQHKQAPLAFTGITLVMKRIWPASTGAYWLYVEQAVTGTAPYRQLIYRLEKIGEHFVSKDFEFIDDAKMAAAVGAWKQPAPLADLKESDFAPSPGCEIDLTRDASGAFVGGIGVNKCLTTYKGAAYVTAEVKMTASQFCTWERGYSRSGAQVWGATQGPYLFLPVTNFDPELD